MKTATATQLFHLGLNGTKVTDEWFKETETGWAWHWYNRGRLVREWTSKMDHTIKPPQLFQNYQASGFASYRDWIYGTSK